MPKRRTRLILTLSALTVLIAGGVMAALMLLNTDGPTENGAVPTAAPTTPPADSPSETAEPSTPVPSEPERIRFIALGDMLPHDSVNLNAQVDGGGWNYGQFFDGISDQLGAADVTFCNQEVPSAGVEYGVTGYPVFNAPVEFARDLHAAVGCDLVNFANNHTADYGTAGIARTREVWNALAPSVIAGGNRTADEQRSVPVFEVDGVTIALVALAEYSNAAIDGVSLNLMADTALVTDLMAQARERADLVIVSAHWGIEDTHELSGQQVNVGQQLADLGADVIIGTGPHVLQPVRWLDRADGGRTLVWYSIGNMLSTQLSLNQLTGVIAGFDIVRDEVSGSLSIENPTAMLTYMHYDWEPQERAAGNLLARSNLGIWPLESSQALLDRTAFGVTATQQIEAMAAVLGPDVSIITASEAATAHAP